MVYTEHLSSLWDPGIWNMPGRAHLCDQTPVVTLRTEPLTSLPGRQHFTRVGTTPCWRTKHDLCDSLREDSGELVLGFPGLCPKHLFPSCAFAVISHSREAWEGSQATATPERGLGHSFPTLAYAAPQLRIPSFQNESLRGHLTQAPTQRTTFQATR